MSEILRRRRALMGAADGTEEIIDTPDIPSAYQKLKYIVCNGSSYFTKTAYTLQSDEKAVTTAMITSETETWEIASGGGTVNSYLAFCRFFADGTVGASWGAKNANCNIGNVVGKQVTTEFVHDTTSFTVSAKCGNKTQTETTAKTDANQPNPIRVGWSGSASGKFHGKIYRVTKRNKSTDAIVQWDFIPAKRISDGKVGMYNNVDGTFFQSETSTPFEAGPNA